MRVKKFSSSPFALLLISFAVLTACISQASNATADCHANPRATSLDLAMCTKQDADAAQQELEALLFEIKVAYPEEQWIPLSQNQQEWELLREKDCAWSRSLWEGGSIAPIYAQSCLARLTTARTRFLIGSVCVDGRYAREITACEEE